MDGLMKVLNWMLLCSEPYGTRNFAMSKRIEKTVASIFFLLQLDPRRHSHQPRPTLNSIKQTAYSIIMSGPAKRKRKEEKQAQEDYAEPMVLGVERSENPMLSWSERSINEFNLKRVPKSWTDQVAKVGVKVVTHNSYDLLTTQRR